MIRMSFIPFHSRIFPKQSRETSPWTGVGWRNGRGSKEGTEEDHVSKKLRANRVRTNTHIRKDSQYRSTQRQEYAEASAGEEAAHGGGRLKWKGKRGSITCESRKRLVYVDTPVVEVI